MKHIILLILIGLAMTSCGKDTMETIDVLQPVDAIASKLWTGDLYGFYFNGSTVGSEVRGLAKTSACFSDDNTWIISNVTSTGVELNSDAGLITLTATDNPTEVLAIGNINGENIDEVFNNTEQCLGS